MRTDVLYEKQECLAVRPEKVPALRPATVHYISTNVCDNNMGVKSERRDFLENPDKNKMINKVIHII